MNSSGSVVCKLLCPTFALERSKNSQNVSSRFVFVNNDVENYNWQADIVTGTSIINRGGDMITNTGTMIRMP